MPTWTDIKQLNSANTLVSKFVFSTEGVVAEAVLYQYPTYTTRTVICCSTQSGCPVGCTFCGTGANFIRSLTTEEIVSQVEHLLKATEVDPGDIERLQIMFMSMGEPLLNIKHLEPALERLAGAYPHAALLISTSGPRIDYGKVQEISERLNQVGLQFSIHESTDMARNALIPFKAKLTLKEIAAEGEAWFKVTSRQPFFNYCTHEANTTEADAQRLRALFDPKTWQATLSVICEKDQTMANAFGKGQEQALAFKTRLEELGYKVRVFNPAGQDDIGGGCGQLWHVQEWIRTHPDQVRKRDKQLLT